MFKYLAAGALAIVGLSVGAAQAVLIDFETGGQIGNFRLLEDEGTTGSGAPTFVQTTTSGNGHARLTGGSGGSRYITTYDSPATTGRDLFAAGLTIELDARLGTAGQSIGIYLIDGNSTTDSSAYLALVNVDNASTTNELIRFSSSANPTHSSNNTSGLETTGVTGNSGYNVSPTNYVHLKLIYTLDANNHPVLDFTVGNFNRSITYSSLTGFANVGVGLRLSSSGQNTIDIDNVKITPVPEPAALAVVGLGAGGLLARRRSRRA